MVKLSVASAFAPVAAVLFVDGGADDGDNDDFWMRLFVDLDVR